MSTSRFSIYFGPLSLNYGTPSVNKPVHGNAVNTQALIDTAIDNMFADLMTSPITDITLWLMHFPDASSPFISQPDLLTINGVPIVPTETPNGDFWSLPPKLPAKIQALRAAGKNVVASMGGYDGSGTFKQIAKIGVDKFIQQLETQLFKPYNVNGLDIDLEAGSNISWYDAYKENAATVVELSNKLAAAGYVVTHAPAYQLSTSFYTDSCPGLPNDMPILQATYNSKTGQQAVSWLNTQFYAGGDPYTSQGAITGFEDMVAALSSQTDKTGIDKPENFLLAGFWPKVEDPEYPSGTQPVSGNVPLDQSPTVVENALNGLKKKYPDGYGGTFDWLYQYFTSSQQGHKSQQHDWQVMSDAL